MHRHPHHQITERDVGVVESVYKHRYLTASQIQTLHFPSETTRNRRLRRLTEHDYLEAFTVLGISERLFRLTRRGAELVASRLGVEPGDLLWSPSTKAPKDYYFMRHFVRLNDVRIALSQACEDGPAELRGFIPEYYGTRKASGRVVKYVKDVTFDVARPHDRIPHTPDAVFSLEKSGRAALFFLEVDRGTETLSNPDKGVLKMVRFYLSYLASGGYERYADDFKAETFRSFRALVVTSSEKRLHNMRETATAALSDRLRKGLRAVWGATFEVATAERILTPVFRSFDANDERTYAIG